MRTGQNGWITRGNTSFITGGDSDIIGTMDYERENTSTVRGLFSISIIRKI